MTTATASGVASHHNNLRLLVDHCTNDPLLWVLLVHLLWLLVLRWLLLILWLLLLRRLHSVSLHNRHTLLLRTSLCLRWLLLLALLQLDVLGGVILWVVGG